MIDEVIKPVSEDSEIEKLHKRLAELEHKAKPVLVHGYLSLKTFLDRYVQKYPVAASWTSGGVGAILMYMVRKWFSF